MPEAWAYGAVVARPPGRLRRKTVAFAAEGLMPRSLGDLAIAWRSDRRRLIVLAVDRELADDWLNDRRTSAKPASLPDSITRETSDLHADRFEFLQGPFTPASVRRQRALRRVIVAMALAMSLLMYSIGAYWRAGAAREDAAAIDAQTERLIADAISSIPSGLAPDLALAAEIRRLEAMNSYTDINVAIDSRQALSSLLSQWPIEFEAQVERLEVKGHSVALYAVLSSRQQALAFANSMARFDGFSTELPRIDTQNRQGGQIVRLALGLEHKGGTSQ